MPAPTIEQAFNSHWAESETLDFKGQIYTDQREWLKDVTAFANTRGGRILLGVEEDKHGRAAEASGLSAEINLDQEINKLYNWLRDGTEPDASLVVHIYPETNDQGLNFLIVDIQESQQGPHRVTCKGEKHIRQIYLRKGRSNEPADMVEIRELFAGTNRTLRSIVEFVDRRRQEVRSSNPLKTTLSQFLVFHVCPRRRFGSRRLADWGVENRHSLLSDQSSTNWPNSRPNFLGAFAVKPADAFSETEDYVQLFYNGSAELAYSSIVREVPAKQYIKSEKGIPGGLVVEAVRRDLRALLETMHRVLGEDCFEVSTTMRGLNGLPLYYKVSDHFGERSVEWPWEELLTLPLVSARIDSNGTPKAEDLTEILDLFWRAWGKDRCPFPSG